MTKVGALLILSCVLCLATAGAQNPRTAAFEVASIKPAAPGSRTRVAFPAGGRFMATSMALKTLLSVAYDVREFRISGGPSWMASDRFDITAKAENASATTNDVVMMLRTLLIERFKIAMHRETRDTTVYGLVVAGGGLKLKPSADGTELSLDGGGGRAIGTRVTMPLLSQFLSQQLGTVILDRTGLSGAYDLTLTWTPDTNPILSSPDAPRPADGPPSIFTAVQEQLGLKLESQRGPVEFIVIDAAQRPTVN